MRLHSIISTFLGKNKSVSPLVKQPFVERHFWKNMDCPILYPPREVRGMTALDRNAFRRVIQVPKLRVPEDLSNKIIPLVKKFILKMEHLKPVRTYSPAKSGPDNTVSRYKEILLHPQPVLDWESLPTELLLKHNVDKSCFYFEDLELTYDNWRADELLKCILPEHEEGMTSYSRIGHIVHINLRDHLLPYKQLIGEVIRDKVPGCRSVVNKASTIDNTYRNFQLELVCGDENYKVEVKESGTIFEFDFSKVYWNPRLSTEHERIVNLLRPGDLLYDVFAGVGPFSVPAAKKHCNVLANDLNPESFKWLNQNAKRNKCTAQMQTFNKDGRAFIMEDIKQDLLSRWTTENKTANKYRVHITMNLPAMAPEFLDAFRGLASEHSKELRFDDDFNFPIVHVYSFAKGENTKELVRQLVEQHLGSPLAENLEGIYFVRNVAPNKDMYRVSFYLTKEILTTSTAYPANRGANKRPATDDEETPEHITNIKLKCSQILNTSQ